MKPLPIEITIGSGSNRFTYRKVIRKGMHAVYSQSQHGRIVAYEAVRIQSHNGYKMNEGQPNEVYIEPAESMPSPSSWGIHGFTFSATSHAKPLEAAMRKMALMMRN